MFFQKVHTIKKYTYKEIIDRFDSEAKSNLKGNGVRVAKERV